jgi:uncharacterized coiled-coil protein SlyX
MLLGAHQAGGQLSSSSKGYEREAFINGFLSEVLTPQFRFGSGDATDQNGMKSGQLDIVVEYPFVPSLPIVAGRSPRLYLAEGIISVVEVKSNVAEQWPQVTKTAEQLAKLTRKYNYEEGVSIGPRAGEKIPLYVVGYEGWSNFEEVKSRVNPANGINGILVIKQGHFAGQYSYLDHKNEPQVFTCESVSSAMALWGLISCIHHAASMVTSATKNVPRRYE